jgi:hypothetical protein
VSLINYRTETTHRLVERKEVLLHLVNLKVGQRREKGGVGVSYAEAAVDWVDLCSPKSALSCAVRRQRAYELLTGSRTEENVDSGFRIRATRAAVLGEGTTDPAFVLEVVSHGSEVVIGERDAEGDEEEGESREKG